MGPLAYHLKGVMGVIFEGGGVTVRISHQSGLAIFGDTVTPFSSKSLENKIGDGRVGGVITGH